MAYRAIHNTHNLNCLRFTFLLLFSLYGTLAKQQSVALLDNETPIEIEARQTQTEVKPGWKIVDIQLKSTLKRYLWGNTAKVYTDQQQPKFIVNTIDSITLSEMVLIKLKTKREYRSIPKPNIYDNNCIYVDFNTFHIEPYKDESFLIQPSRALEPGEYIFTWISLPPIGEYRDWMVWPFSVKKTDSTNNKYKSNY